MAIRIVTSWKTLFQLAHAEGQARKAYNANPTPAAAERLESAIESHHEYKQVCLKADEMIDFPDIR